MLTDVKVKLINECIKKSELALGETHMTFGLLNEQDGNFEVTTNAEHALYMVAYQGFKLYCRAFDGILSV